MPVNEAPVIAATRALSGIYPRFGGRRIRVLRGREGMRVGKERCARLALPRWCLLVRSTRSAPST